jgi:hypothetical protein
VSDEFTGDLTRGREGALHALIEASTEPDIVSDYTTIANSFTRSDYEAVIDLAWRHQFNVERLNFKREVRELQQHVSEQVMKNLEVVE